MRGKIIQYNGADGSGTIVADGKQYRFDLPAWRGNAAPTLNKTVEIELDGDTITNVHAVGEDVLMKEKAAEMGDKLGAMWNKAASSVQSARTNRGTTAQAAPGDASPYAGAAAGVQTMPGMGGGNIVDLIRQRYGVVIPIAWFLFLLGTLAFNSVTMDMFNVSRGWSMFNLADIMSRAGGGGGFVKFLLIVGYLGIAVPMFWRNRLAWLFLLVPLIAVLWAVYDVLHLLDQMGMGSQMASDIYGTGFGFWLALVMSIILALFGIGRFLRGR